jgi:purine catabolism regulator
MVTVGWLARQPDLGLTVVAGAEHAERTILWAHAIELADPTPYLSGGELVMTTGLKLGGTKRAQFDYVSRLVTAGAAALAFDTGTNFRQVPEGIIAAGDELGLPVLRVPATTPFIAITRAVIDAINADQLKSVRRTVELQERLARETLRGGIPALVTALSRALGATAVALSTDGRLLAAGGPPI